VSGARIISRFIRACAIVACTAVAAIAQGCTGPGACLHGGNWPFKTGIDRDADKVSLEPVETTVDALIGVPHVERPDDGHRIWPEEVTTWVIRDVTLEGFQRSPDGDVHMMVADEHGHMVIIEVTPDFCTDEKSPWGEQIAAVRKVVDDEIPMALIGWRHLVMSVAGVGYFDYMHGQFGAAPNGIELHPVLAICLGQGCTLPDPRGSKKPVAR
jgi:hypothetical protein